MTQFSGASGGDAFNVTEVAQGTVRLRPDTEAIDRYMDGLEDRLEQFERRAERIETRLRQAAEQRESGGDSGGGEDSDLLRQILREIEESNTLLRQIQATASTGSVVDI